LKSARDNLIIRDRAAHDLSAGTRKENEMTRIRSIARHAASAALLAAAAVGGPAHAVLIDVGSYTLSGLGAEFTTSFDTFTITGDKVSIAMPQTSSPVAISLGTFWFEVGPHCYSCTLTPSFDALVDIKVHGDTKQFDIPYAWHSSGPNDFLTFSQPAPVMFDFGNQGVLVIALDAIATLVSPGGKVYGDLYATASLAPASITPVPEPAGYALMLAGFGVVAFVARRRRS